MLLFKDKPINKFLLILPYVNLVDYAVHLLLSAYVIPSDHL